MAASTEPLGPARLGVREALADTGGRYGRDCKTVYTGSSPVVASIT